MVYGDVVTHSDILLFGNKSVWSGFLISRVSGKRNREEADLEIRLNTNLKFHSFSDLLPPDMPNLLMVP